MKVKFLLSAVAATFLFTSASWADVRTTCSDEQGHSYNIQYEAYGVAQVAFYKDDLGKVISGTLVSPPGAGGFNGVTVFTFPNANTLVVGNLHEGRSAYLFTDFAGVSFNLNCN